MSTRGGTRLVAERPLSIEATSEPAIGRGLDLFEAKLRPPQQPSRSVFRAPLVERLQASRSKSVIILSAPAGYGKSTVLAQWASRSHRPFAWVAVDERDNDPVVLLTYTATALDRLEPLPRAVFDALAVAHVTIDRTAVPRLASALAEMERPLILALDDLQALHNPRCFDVIDALVDHLPRESQLVLSGQVQPSRRLGQLRTQGRVLEIGPADLRMGDSEARELLGAAGVELPDDELAALTEITEGWPAGLYLAALSVKDGEAAIRSFHGDNRMVTDYLSGELLARLPGDELRFLTRTSVLEEMCGELCDAMLGSTGSAAVLESLERSNMFVVPLDENGRWYRYHGLFRDLLRAELERAEANSVPDLLGRAADWCDANGRSVEAVGYAQAAGDVERVADLVERRAQHEYEHGRAVTVERWLAWLEQHGSLESVPGVAVLGAWLSAIRGRAGDAERWTDAAERGSQHLAAASGEPLVQPWLAVLHAGRGQGGVERMRADAELAARSFGRNSNWWPTPALLLAVSHLLAGDDERADDLFAEIAETATAFGAWNAVSIALAERGILAAGRSNWVEAEALSEQAQSVIRRSAMGDYPPNALAYVLGARVAAHRGEGSRAQSQLALAQRLRAYLTRALLAFSIQTRLELARAYIALADYAGARTVLREANGLMRRGAGLGRLEDQAREIEASLESVRAEVPGASTLTSAELRLLPYLPTHLTFREIGERIYVSRHTVKSQMTSIYRKLDVCSRNDAVQRARALGLLDA